MGMYRAIFGICRLADGYIGYGILHGGYVVLYNHIGVYTD